MTDDRQLVLISGPIASGKSSLALELAARARRIGGRAAAVDMDVLVETVGGDDWSLVTKEHRVLAPELAAGLINQLFDRGFSLVAVAGSTLLPYEWERLLVNLDRRPPTLRVLLRVTLEESIRRAQSDPTRVGTKDAGFVGRVYSRINWQELAPADIEVATDGLTMDDVADIVAARLLTLT